MVHQRITGSKQIYRPTKNKVERGNILTELQNKIKRKRDKGRLS
jgi:hypothetical protein